MKRKVYISKGEVETLVTTEKVTEIPLSCEWKLSQQPAAEALCCM